MCVRAGNHQQAHGHHKQRSEMLKRLLHPGDVLLGTVYAPKSLANDHLKVQGVTTLGFKLLVF